MLHFKMLAAVMTLGLLVPTAQARTNAACIATAGHVQSVLSARPEIDAILLSSLQSFRQAQEQALDKKIIASAKAYNMDVAALSKRSIEERKTMGEQLNNRFGTETLYRDHLVMLVNCAKISESTELGQSKTAFQNMITLLEGELG